MLRGEGGGNPLTPRSFRGNLEGCKPQLRVYFALCMTGGQFESEWSKDCARRPWPSDGRGRKRERERVRVALATGQVMFLELARDFPLSHSGAEGGHETCSFG